MKLSRIRLIVYTLILTIGALWITNPIQKISPQPEKTQDAVPQFSWKTQDTTIWSLKTETPNQQSIIATQQFSYKNDDKSSQFLQPKVFILEDESITSIMSDNGQTQDDAVINFNKNVNITHYLNDKDNQDLVQLKTDYLTYNAQEQSISTDSAIAITFPQGQLTGTGFTGSLETRQFQIKSNVRTRLNTTNTDVTVKESK